MKLFKLFKTNNIYGFIPPENRKQPNKHVG